MHCDTPAVIQPLSAFMPIAALVARCNKSYINIAIPMHTQHNGTCNTSAVVLAVLPTVAACQVNRTATLIVTAALIIRTICTLRNVHRLGTAWGHGVSRWRARSTCCSCTRRDVWPEGLLRHGQVPHGLLLCAAQHTCCPLTCTLITCQGIAMW